MKKPLIVVSNDDGITSKGIRVLVEEMAKIGEVIVIAPDSPNSGKGHAITIDAPIHIKNSPIFGDIESYECSGTPADCIKLAKHELIKGRDIDLVVSGINHGHNAALSVIYSGTMSAAIEAAVEGIPAIGLSLNDFAYDADFEHIRPFIQDIIRKVLDKGMPSKVALNVNFPPKSEHHIRGVKVLRQADGYWKENFDARKDPYGRPYFWLTGEFVNREPQLKDDYDIQALENHYISIVPCKYDLTDYQALESIKHWF